MNREFLYRYFKIVKRDAAGSPKSVRAVARSRLEPFQYRMDRKWRDEKDTQHAGRRYVYHCWPDSDTCHRHAIGRYGQQYLSGDAKQRQEQLKRLRDLLHERVSNISWFSLPMPDASKHASFRRLQKECSTFGNYIRTIAKAEAQPGLPHWKNIWGQKEVLWNELIIDLLKAVRYKGLYGNHDGYRADPLLNTGIDAKHRCPQGWISEKGIWFEHGNRWDEYNRDGIAFGAAVTNYVYHYRNNLTSGWVNTAKGYVLAERWNSLLPGAALWYALVNYPYEFKKITGQKKPGAVKPFGIFVFGHTHDADLVRLRFDRTVMTKAKHSIQSTIYQIQSIPEQIERAIMQRAFSPWYY